MCKATMAPVLPISVNVLRYRLELKLGWFKYPNLYAVKSRRTQSNSGVNSPFPKYRIGITMYTMGLSFKNCPTELPLLSKQ